MTPKRIEPKDHDNPPGRLLGRIGILTRQPVIWAAATGILVASDNPRLRRAAVRGACCYLMGATLGNGIKPVFNRAQPRHLRPKKPQVMRGSFPSGHGAAEVAYVFGASKEAPELFVPFGIAALLGHWALVRDGKHYVSDMLAGGTLGIAIAFAGARAWPPGAAGAKGPIDAPRPNVLSSAYDRST